MFKTRNAGCVLRFKRKRKIANAKIYEDKRDLYCMYISRRREYYICMHPCMYACIIYVCMYVRYSARRSLFSALIDALGGIYVSQVEYACIMNVCIYRRADSTGSTIYVCICMHACIIVCMYVCMYAIPRAIWRADRRNESYGCVSNIICMYYDCMYVSTRREYWEYWAYVTAADVTCSGEAFWLVTGVRTREMGSPRGSLGD